MQKLLRFNYRKACDRGFTTLEILISIIIALAFVSVTMQSFVLGVAMKVQAQEKQRANQLIQEDLEILNNLASNIPAEVAGVAPNPDHTFIQRCNAEPPGGGAVGYANGFAKELVDLVETDRPNGDSSLSVQLLQDKNGNGSGKTLTLTRTDVSAGDPTATPPVPISSVSPHRTLKINYRVTDVDNNNNVVAERYVEVIPDVALRCP